MASEVQISAGIDAVVITIHDQHAAEEYAALLYEAATKGGRVDQGFMADYEDLDRAIQTVWGDDDE